MKIEKNRHMMIMYSLVHAAGPLTAEQIGEASRASVRTVKSDIAYLNKELSRYSEARIVSHKAKGYMVEADDPDEIRKLISELDIMYSLFYNRSIENVNRRMYILQRLLTDEYVTTEEISERLFLTKSALRRDYAWAIRFLKSYRIEVVSVAGKGYHIVGREQDIRSALVEVHCSQYHEFNPLYPYEPFNQQFYRDGTNIYPEIRKAFLDILRSSEIVIYDIAGKKLATHLCLMQSRIRKGKKIEFAREIADELKRTYDYEIAGKILSSEVMRRYMDPDENEVLNLARLLLINRDINMRQKGNDNLPLGMIIGNLSVFNQVIRKARKQLGGAIYDLDLFKVYSRDLESLQMQIYLKNHFDYTDVRRMITYAEGREETISPLAMEMARILIMELENALKVTVRDNAATFYAAILSNIINKIDFLYHKRNIIACSTNGLVSAQMLREKLLNDYGKYINTVEVYNFYELRKLDLTGYEVVMDSSMTMYNHYNTKVISYTNPDYAANNQEIF
ncbi:MAG: HTH domain-containing protein, partial [Erysipelotrichaceae bacterium]|nr:HTH domain-containing protein [Erysipelotrichaceae bacterium]